MKRRGWSSIAADMDPSASRTVVIAGATGMVGSRALLRLLEGSAFERVVAVARRPLPARPRLETRVVDFGALERAEPVPAAAALCALGTTIRAARTEAAFRAVDHDAIVSFARWARRGGAPTFVLVSSVGADPRSRNFYLRVKGEAEESVAALGFARFITLRPALMLGPRAERRLAEGVAQAVFPALNPLLVGPLRRYRALSGDTVAAALIAAARDPAPGREVWDVDRIRRAQAD
jgi:uncharacterized protein YbjT (DUF2867 family)